MDGKTDNRADIKNLDNIPNVGPATVGYLNMLGINEPCDLIGRDPYLMFEQLCSIAGRHFDPCLADVFISAVKYMEGGPPRKWWYHTKERKRHFTENASISGTRKDVMKTGKNEMK